MSRYQTINRTVAARGLALTWQKMTPYAADLAEDHAVRR
jgi:hypothetical protein